MAFQRDVERVVDPYRHRPPQQVVDLDDPLADVPRVELEHQEIVEEVPRDPVLGGREVEEPPGRALLLDHSGLVILDNLDQLVEPQEADPEQRVAAPWMPPDLLLRLPSLSRKIINQDPSRLHPP